MYVNRQSGEQASARPDAEHRVRRQTRSGSVFGTAGFAQNGGETVRACEQFGSPAPPIVARIFGDVWLS
ncbi:MAG: hypothetical protein ACYTFA_10425 [Planctomycetota bacterium]|jgi:hypothetical protein